MVDSASVKNLGGSYDDGASADSDELADPPIVENDPEEPDSEKSKGGLKEAHPEGLDDALRVGMLRRASDIEEILIAGEKRNTISDAQTTAARSFPRWTQRV